MSKQSLASRQMVESNPGAGLPVGFDGSGPIQVSAPKYRPTPYALFVSNKGQTFAKVAQQIPNIQDGDPVLCVGDVYTRLNPFRFYLVSAFHHFSEVNSMGEIVASTLDAEAAREGGDRWQEHIETALIVITDTKLVPATCTFKTVKAAAAQKAVDALAVAKDDEKWGSLSPEHKASLHCPLPYGRFITTCTLKRVTSKKGRAYVAASGFVRPTTLADWEVLASAFKDREFISLCEAVWNRHSDRIAEIKSRI